MPSPAPPHSIRISGVGAGLGVSFSRLWGQFQGQPGLRVAGETLPEGRRPTSLPGVLMAKLSGHAGEAKH